MSKLAESEFTTQIFDTNEFWPAFIEDLAGAKARIIILSPYLKIRRIKQFARQIYLARKRNVVVCVFISELFGKSLSKRSVNVEVDFEVKELMSNMDALKELGVHVNLSESIHQKFAIIDEPILWEGSLNILSQNLSHEHMRRWNDEREVGRIMAKHRLGNCEQCTLGVLNYFLGDEVDMRLKRLANLVHAQRNDQKLSLRTLAKKCGVHVSQIKKLESGNNVTVDTLFRVLSGLGLEPAFISNWLAAPIAQYLHDANSPKLPK